MSKLKKFSKTNKKNIMPLVSLCTVVAVVSAAISYAVYQKENEVLFINARVGEFETTSSDIELSMTLDGNDIDTPPSKGYYNVTVECDHADGEWDKEKWGAIITNISSNRVKCNVNFETLETRPLSIVELGDYISMTPTSTSYTISTSLTGYSANQTINPSELNLWRVIRKNEDGTVDIVSEYVSSTLVYFRGQTGYLNLVGSLNTIAAQYTNSKYVLKTRYMGYSGQTLKCSSLSTTSCPGDTGYETDTNLVQEAIGTLVGKKPNNTGAGYILNTRYLSSIDGHTWYGGRYVTGSGVINGTDFCDIPVGGGLIETNRQYALRPILTLKSTVEILSGDGKSIETSYQLN